MTIPQWNLAEGTTTSISNLRNAGNWDDMGVYFDISRTEVRHAYQIMFISAAHLGYILA